MFLNQGIKAVLIDDDPLFCTLFAQFAKKLGVTVHYYHSVTELAYNLVHERYDVAIVDFDLGTVTGVDLAAALPMLLGDMPVIIISGDDRDRELFKPKELKIVDFCLKNTGPWHILGRACEVSGHF